MGKYLKFELPAGVSYGNRGQLFEALRGIEELYYSMQVLMKTDPLTGKEYYEYVNGFIPYISRTLYLPAILVFLRQGADMLGSKLIIQIGTL